ncbi:MAG TPA: DUF2334 domain-containing protein [Candidatus Acidoferrales bacterium]|nr:DUF2334 domain-containing protein [Candidatus Acidoferrales bacterium]
MAKVRYAVAAAIVTAVILALYFMRASIVPVATAPIVFPKHIGSILVLIDHFPGDDRFARQRAEQVAIGLRYLTPRTSWAFLDAASVESVRRAQAVVYLGLNGLTHLSPGDLATLRAARRLIVSQHHLSDLRTGGVAFADVAGGTSMTMPPGTTMTYRGFVAPVAFAELLDLQVRSPARALADYVLPGGKHIPYIVADGAALFVNAPLSFVFADAQHAAMPAACDAIASFLGAAPNPRPLAMLRLEDVSSITPATRLASIAYYLWSAHVPYGIGVIPDLRIEHGTAGPLGKNPMLVFVLKWAQAHGATIILHGLHHCCSAQDAEGYEFWDYDHNAPLSYDSAAWMRAQIAEGFKDETSLGLHPQMWETPHYSASPVDYATVAQVFDTSWELRRPVGWLPWPLQRDQYGSVLLPENLGYVSLDGTHTVNDQLTRAHALLACRYCVAAGFIHPALLSVGTVAAYVQGLRKMGYVFADPRQFALLRTNGT